MLPEHLVKKFPKLLADGAIKTSDACKQYNCIAWSASRDKKHWWQPVLEEPYDYWPHDVPQEQDCTPESLIILFEKRGYTKCDLNSGFEFFYKKVAIYGAADWKETSKLWFSHVCDQLNSGAWTSKLSSDEDIQHNTLEALEGYDGNEYGKVVIILKKRCGPLALLARIYLKLKSLF